MQRWMEAKMQRARRHGAVKSGAGRAMGYVSEDRVIRRGTAEPFQPISDHKPDVIRLPKGKRPTAWGASKAARRALTDPAPWNMTAASLTTTNPKR